MAKILLVEDDNNLREIYEARLQAEGYEIASAKDGEEALVVAKEEKPDLIISDVMMPKISGFEMLDILRNTAGLKETKVIMLTALGQAEDQTRADKLGADRYLVKSQVTLEDIVKVSHELLGDGVDEQPTDNTYNQNSLQNNPETNPVPEPVVEQPEAIETPEPVVPDPVVEQSEPVNVQPVVPDPVVEQPEAIETPEPVVPEPVVEQPEAIETPEPVVPEPVVEQPEAIETPEPEPNSELPNTNNLPADTAINEEIAIDANGALTQTEAQETETMNQKIQNFLNDDTTPKEDNESSAPTQVNTEEESTQAVNDQTLAEAVNNLMSSNTNSSDSLVTKTTPEINKNIETNELVSSPTVASKNSQVEINGKKTINPIEITEPKKSLDELLAEEEAIEKVTEDVNNQQIAENTNKPFDASDPNNIAL